MTKKNEGCLLVVCLLISLIGVIMLYGFQIELEAEKELVVRTSTYLTGLATLFLAWRRIDHKIPPKRKKIDEH